MLTIVTHEACRRYDPGPAHPDRPARLDEISNSIIASRLGLVCRWVDAPEVSVEALERVHDPDYIKQVFARAPTERDIWLDADTKMTPESLPAALRAAGAVVWAVDELMAGNRGPIFCAVRPPGHHAGRSTAAGFCFFNNVAVGACHALEAHGLQRVAIVDFDVHHGDGTEAIFRDEARVLYCSTFEKSTYPWTGRHQVSDRLVSIPLTADSGSEGFRSAVHDFWLPALTRFEPELLLISAGFDAHAGDDMSGLALTDYDFEWLTQSLVAIAARFANERIVSVLEGGYMPELLGRSVRRHLAALLDG